MNKFAVSALAAFFALPAFASQNVVKVDDLHPGVVIDKSNMMAADLAIWNPPSR